MGILPSGGRRRALSSVLLWHRAAGARDSSNDMKTHIKPIRHILCAISLLAATGSFAADTPTSSRASTDRSVSEAGQLTRGDRRFVDKLAKLGMEEVALSKIAAERASNAEVRTFAQELVTAHEKVNSELSRLASSKGVIPAASEQPNLDKWARKDASDFDKDYLDKMIDAHEDSIDLLESNARKSQDTELASFSRTNLPAIQEHLLKAKNLKSQLR